ncbi:hypothetical protein [Acetobacter sp.]|uniref:hypothetical protein n=1 Tax=Acetobacter sp. TaxID=440 RepID=UPI0039E85ADF
MIKRTTDRYVLEYKQNPRTLVNEFIITSTVGAGHKAKHTHYTLYNDDGSVIGNFEITSEIANFISNNFEARGDTASFSIYKSDLDSGHLLPRDHSPIQVNEVRHHETHQETSFTATGSKLSYHWPIFEKYRDTGYGSIIRATMTNHQVCASRCQFCSTISRNKRDSVSLEEAKEFVRKLYFDQANFNKEKFPTYNHKYKKVTGSDIRLRGLILSGGGQPNLWPHFTEFVRWLADLDIDLGLITNGFPRSVPEDVYDHFKWIRISITPENASPFYPQGRFDLQYLPENIKNNPDITVGYSYVYGPWTTDDILERIVQSIDDNGFRYCRTLADCNLARHDQLQAHKALAERLFSLKLTDEQGRPLHKIFHQLKYHGTPEEASLLWEDGQCYLQSYSVFWDTTGHENDGSSFCYPCDSVTVLAEEHSNGKQQISERKFDPTRWGTVKNTDVEKLFTMPIKPYFDPREQCSSCLFMRNNKAVKMLLSNPEGPPESGMAAEHINFP